MHVFLAFYQSKNHNCKHVVVVNNKPQQLKQKTALDRVLLTALYGHVLSPKL